MVRKTGFDYVEFGSWAQHDIKKIKSLLEENRLQLGCFSGDKDYNLIDPAHCKEFLEYFKRSVEAAHFLDCKNLVIHSNALGEEGRMCTDGNDLNDRTKIACATKPAPAPRGPPWGTATNPPTPTLARGARRGARAAPPPYAAGTGTTLMPRAWASLTICSPGSLMQGIPASEQSAQLSPASMRSKIAAPWCKACS